MSTLVCGDCGEPESDSLEVHCICNNCVAGWNNGEPTIEELQTVLQQVATYLGAGAVGVAQAVVAETLLRFKKVT